MEMKELATQIEGFATSLEGLKSAQTANEKKFSDAIAALEAKQNAVGTAQADKTEFKAMADYIRTGVMEQKTGVSPSTTTNNVSGGYLAIPDFQKQVYELVEEAYPLVGEVDTIRINGNAMYLPVEVSKPEARWRSENPQTAIPASLVELKVENIALQSLRTKVLVSDELMADSNLVSIEQYLTSACSKSLGRAMSNAILYGRGAETYNEPNGITTDADFATIDSASSGAISAGDIFDLIGSVPSTALPNAKFVMSNATFMKVAKTLGSSEIVQLPLSESIKPALFGYEVVFADVEAVGANKVPMIFGDLAGYKAVQAGGLTYKRDEYSAADYGQVAVRFWNRIGGKLVDPNAIVGLKIKA